jgi:hypothetical protein
MSVHLNQHGRAVGLVIQAQETGVDLQAAEGRKPKGFSVRHLGTLRGRLVFLLISDYASWNQASLLGVPVKSSTKLVCSVIR